MYTEPIGSNNVPAFLSKLWRLVDSSQNNDLISWSPNGKSFIIRNQAKFAKDLLPLYFKHNNMASFIRQLNMYGFRKITHIENSGLKVENDEIEFYHSCFVKGQESMLEYIKRKNSLSVAHIKSNGAFEDKTNKEDVHLILTDVKGIKNKQDSMNSMLVSLQNENEALWKEIATLRHKHQKQQQIVERLIHFLMSLVQSGNIGLKRKGPLMIDNKNGNKNVDLASVASNLLNSGPIIQEITHGLLDDDDYDNDLNSPIINTARSDTSEPVQPFDETTNDDSPIFGDTPISSNLNPSQQQSIELGELNENTDNDQLDERNLFDPLQESINAMNAEENDQIIDLNAVGAVPVESPSSTPIPTTVQNIEIANSYPSTQQSMITSTNLPTTTSNVIDNPNQLKLVLPSNNNSSQAYDSQSNLMPSTSSVLNTPSITAETFDNHLEGIDTELTTLQEQLLGNFNIDSNVLMGLFAQDELNKGIQTINAVPTSSMGNSPLSTPKPVIQREPTIIEPNDLNSNFDLADIVGENYSTEAENLFDNQTGDLLNNDEQMMKQQNLISQSYESMDNASIFNSDDLLTTDSDLNQLLNVPSSDEQDLFQKDRKRKRIS